MRESFIAMMVEKLSENKFTDDFISLTDCCYRYNPAEIVRILEKLGWIEDTANEVVDGYRNFKFFDKDNDTIVLYFDAFTFDIELQNFIPLKED